MRKPTGIRVRIDARDSSAAQGRKKLHGPKSDHPDPDVSDTYYTYQGPPKDALRWLLGQLLRMGPHTEVALERIVVDFTRE